MLTGRRAFEGEDVSDVLASVLAREPDWSRLPRTLSPALGATSSVVSRKTRSSGSPISPTCVWRWTARVDTGSATNCRGVGRSAADGENALSNCSGCSPRERRLWAWAVERLARHRTARRHAIHYVLPQGQRLTIGASIVQLLTVSPDGRRFCPHSSSGGFYVRSMGELSARVISGTGASNLNPLNPVFSRVRTIDCRFRHGEVRRIATSGGAPVIIAKTQEGAQTGGISGASWGADTPSSTACPPASGAYRRTAAHPKWS